jgi:hypothetical protein
MFKGNESPRVIKRKDYEGAVGEKRHITRSEDVIIPLEKVLSIPGAKGEKREFSERGFGNYSSEGWSNFLDDLRTNGLNDPIFIIVDPGVGPRVYEGNHRIQAAKQLGWKTIPAEIRYTGHAERDNELMESKRTFKRFLNECSK